MSPFETVAFRKEVDIVYSSRKLEVYQQSLIAVTSDVILRESGQTSLTYKQRTMFQPRILMLVDSALDSKEQLLLELDLLLRT